jgi:single-strand DNA-binding protein
MNVVALTGRIGNEPEMKYTANGLAMVNLRLAVKRQRKGEEGADDSDWFGVTVFGQAAEFVSQYLGKGALVAVSGRLQQRQWETDGGEKRSVVEVVAERVDAPEGKAEAARRRGGGE